MICLFHYFLLGCVVVVPNPLLPCQRMPTVASLDVGTTGLAYLGDNEFALTSYSALYKYSFTSPVVDLELQGLRTNPILRGVDYWSQRGVFIIVDSSYPQALLIVNVSQTRPRVQQTIIFDVPVQIVGAAIHPLYATQESLKLFIGTQYSISVFLVTLNADIDGLISINTTEKVIDIEIMDLYTQALGVWCSSFGCHVVIGGSTPTDAVLRFYYIDAVSGIAELESMARLDSSIGGIVAGYVCGSEQNPCVLMAPYCPFVWSCALCMYCIELGHTHAVTCHARGPGLHWVAIAISVVIVDFIFCSILIVVVVYCCRRRRRRSKHGWTRIN